MVKSWYFDSLIVVVKYLINIYICISVLKNLGVFILKLLVWVKNGIDDVLYVLLAVYNL